MKTRPENRSPAWLNGPWFWFGTALVVRLVYLVEQYHTSVLFRQFSLDEAEMLQAAQSILKGEGFGPEPLFKAPLYPLLLALIMGVGGEAWSVLARLAQHFCGALAAVMAWDVARRIAPAGKAREWAGPIAAAAIAFYGPLVRLENQLLLDFLTFFLQAAMLWALVRGGTATQPKRQLVWIGIAGTGAMLSVLNRPTILPVLPFLAAWLAWQLPRSSGFSGPPIRRGLAPALFLLPVVAGMCGIYVRNLSAGGEGLWLPWQGGFSFYHANRPGANGRYYLQTDFSQNQTGNPTRELILEGYRAARTNAADSVTGKLSFRRVDQYWFDRARSEILEDPARWLRLMFAKGVGLFSTREIFNIEDYQVQRKLSRVLPWLPVGFGLLWPPALASLACWRLWPAATRRLTGLLYLYLVLLGGAITLYYISGRFRMPLVFPVAVCAAVSLATCRESLALEGRKAWLIGWLVLAGLGAGWSWGDWWGVRSEQVQHQDYARLSLAAFRDGQAALALRYADQAARLKPDYALIPGLRGQAFVELQRFPEAVECFTRAAELAPRDPIPALNLGLIFYYHLNRPEAAARWLREARRRQPSLYRALGMLVFVHVQSGRLAEAEAGLRELERLERMDARTRQIWLLAGLAFACKTHNEQTFDAYWSSWKQTFGESAIDQAREELQRLGVSEQLDAYRAR